MSGTSTPLERDNQMLAIGKQCHHSTCRLVDFLPFKCQHCQGSFCQVHFMPKVHQCPQYDESKFDRVAPNCPLCNTPIPIPPGEDPNIRMDRHLQNECGGQGKKKGLPVCARGKCGKVLFAPISCDQCKKQFCPAHRFPADHTCTAKPPITATSASSSKPALGSRPGALMAGSRLLNLSASKAAFTSNKVAPSSSLSAKLATPKAGTSTPAGNNPFSKTDSASSMSTLTPTHLDDDNTLCDKPEPVIKPVPSSSSNSFVPPPIFSF